MSGGVTADDGEAKDLYMHSVWVVEAHPVGLGCAHAQGRSGLPTLTSTHSRGSALP